MDRYGEEKDTSPSKDTSPIIVIDVNLALPFFCQSEDESKAFINAIEKMGHEYKVVRHGR